MESQVIGRNPSLDALIMSNKPLVLINISLLALVMWLLMKPGPQADRDSATTPPVQVKAGDIKRLERRINALEQELNQVIAARINLERQLQNEQPVSVTDSSSGGDNVVLQQSASVQPSETATGVVEQSTVEERLFAFGMPQETIQAMRMTIDQNQLQMLQLRDRAIREGWNDSDDYREQMSALRNPYRALREKFGDEAYDQYLYATDTPNRVQVQDVYSGSAADNAGLKPGDVIISYATSPVYSMSTLRQSTLEGIAGETILLELQRDGRQVTVSVPRGPLGISMTPVVIKPG